MVITTEELRLAALNTSAKRSLWVARRRIFMRWLGWIMWHIVLPGVGLFTLLAGLFVFVAWHYVGSDTALKVTQNWIQGYGEHNSPLAPTQAEHREIIAPSLNPVTAQAPSLQMDRNYLNLKPQSGGAQPLLPHSAQGQKP